MLVGLWARKVPEEIDGKEKYTLYTLPDPVNSLGAPSNYPGLPHLLDGPGPLCAPKKRCTDIKVCGKIVN